MLIKFLILMAEFFPPEVTTKKIIQTPLRPRLAVYTRAEFLLRVRRDNNPQNVST